MKLRVLIYSVLFTTILQAQNYSYITDRRFIGPEDLIGYDFKPDFMEIPNDTEKQLTPASIHLGSAATTYTLMVVISKAFTV